MRRSAHLLVFTSLALGACTSPGASAPVSGLEQDYRDVVQSLVDETAAALHLCFEDVESTTEARTELARSYVGGNRFFEDRSGYFYMNNLEGLNIAHGTQTELQDADRLLIEDINGKRYIQEILEAAQERAENDLVAPPGFVDYFFDNPATGSVEEKNAYGARLGASEFVLTSAYYLEAPADSLPDAEKDLLWATLFADSFSQGASGTLSRYPADEHSQLLGLLLRERRFLDNQLGYFVVFDHEGALLVHGMNPSAEGEDFSQRQDADGLFYVQELLQLAASSESAELQRVEIVDGERQSVRMLVRNLADGAYVLSAEYPATSD